MENRALRALGLCLALASGFALAAPAQAQSCYAVTPTTTFKDLCNVKTDSTYEYFGSQSNYIVSYQGSTYALYGYPNALRVFNLDSPMSPRELTNDPISLPWTEPGGTGGAITDHLRFMSTLDDFPYVFAALYTVGWDFFKIQPTPQFLGVGYQTFSSPENAWLSGALFRAGSSVYLVGQRLDATAINANDGSIYVYLIDDGASLHPDSLTAALMRPAATIALGPKKGAGAYASFGLPSGNQLKYYVFSLGAKQYLAVLNPGSQAAIVDITDPNDLLNFGQPKAIWAAPSPDSKLWEGQWAIDSTRSRLYVGTPATSVVHVFNIGGLPNAAPSFLNDVPWYTDATITPANNPTMVLRGDLLAVFSGAYAGYLSLGGASGAVPLKRDSTTGGVGVTQLTRSCSGPYGMSNSKLTPFKVGGQQYVLRSLYVWGDVMQISQSCMSTVPIPSITVVRASQGSLDAACTGGDARGYPGDSFTITNTSIGSGTNPVLSVSGNAGTITANGDGTWTWVSPSTQTGPFTLDLDVQDATGAHYLASSQSPVGSKTVNLCGTPSVSAQVTEVNVGGTGGWQTLSSYLTLDTVRITASYKGTPVQFGWIVKDPTGAVSAPNIGAALFTKDLPLALPNVGANGYTVTVAAQYGFAGAPDPTSCGSVDSSILSASVYNACYTLSVPSLPFSAGPMKVSDGTSTATSSSTATLLKANTITFSAPYRVATGYTPTFQWGLTGATPPAVDLGTAGTVKGTIAAGTMAAGSYTASLTANAQQGASSPVSVQVAPVTFSVIDCVNPGAATPTAPANGSTQTAGYVTLSWNPPATGSQPFTYEVWDGSGTLQLCQAATATSCQTYASAAATYYWKVKTIVGCSSTFSWSERWSFTIPPSAPPPPPPPTTLTISPDKNPANVGDTVTFSLSPTLSQGGDTLTILFGDGGGQTITYAGNCILGVCPTSVKHVYSATGTYPVSGSGTAGGTSVAGNTSVQIINTCPLPSAPIASFSWTPSVVRAGTPVQFLDSSSGGPTSWLWDFGDGYLGIVASTTSPLQNPVMTFTTPATYSVKLTATNCKGSSQVTQQVTVLPACALPSAPTAGFTWTPAVVRAGTPVQFMDGSAGGPTAWAWDFGDGVAGIVAGGSSTLQNPVYTYPTTGFAYPKTFTITLTASNCKGSSVVQQQLTVLPACAAPGPPVPDFVWGPTGPLASFPEQPQPYVGQQVTLTDASTNSPTSWHWYDFQEGSVNQTVSTPTFTFTWTVAGDKNVRLTATNCAGTSPEKLKVVHIYDDVRHVNADFSTTPADLTTGVPITFTAAQGYANGDPNTFTWTFDDGTTQTGASVAYTFKCSGSHKVTLVAARRNASGASYSATTTKGLNVGGKACGPESVMAVDAAKVLGLNSTNWHADLRIFNASKYPTSIWLEFLPAGTDNVQPFKVGPYQPPLAPKGTLVLDDILQWAADNFKQNFTKAALRITYQNEDSVAPIVLVRTYNLLPDGSKYGQMNPGIQVYPGTTKSPVWLTGLRNNGLETGFRTNYSIVNLRGDTSCASCITFTLFDETGTALGTKTAGLWAFGYIQDSIKNLFGASFANIGTFSLKVDFAVGQDMQAYASVMDNVTGDPVMIPATTVPASPIYLVAMAHNGGVANTVWRTDLQITNPDGSAPHAWEVKYLPKASDKLPAVVRPVTLAPYKSLLVTDAISWVFSGLLPDTAETSGVIRIAPLDGSGIYPVVSARSYNQTPTGTFGQGIPSLWAARGVSAAGPSTRLLLTGMSSEDIARTNLGFINLSETDGVDMAIYFYDESGNLLNPQDMIGNPIPYTFAIGPGGWDQDKLENRFNRAFKSYNRTLPSNLRSISAEVIVRGGGPAMVYASVIDTMTGDPNFIAAQPAP